MTNIRHANDTAQAAFRRLLDHHLRHREWSPALLADWHAAEAVLDESVLDANFDAVMAEIDALEAEELARIPDVPLAWTPVESTKLAEYWNRGA